MMWFGLSTLKRRTGVPVLYWGGAQVFLTGVLYLLLPSHRCLAAPQGTAEHRFESAEPGPDLLADLFLSENDRRLLQSYIQTNLKENPASPVLKTWEQEMFFLFLLHDYDHSGRMDGLELMSLLKDFQSHHTLTPNTADSVVTMVDLLLQNQDLNGDGLLAPSELLSPLKTQPKLDKQNSTSHDAPAQPAEEDLQQLPVGQKVVAQETDNSELNFKHQDEPHKSVEQAEEPHFPEALKAEQEEPHVPEFLVQQEEKPEELHIQEFHAADQEKPIH